MNRRASLGLSVESRSRYTCAGLFLPASNGSALDTYALGCFWKRWRTALLVLLLVAPGPAVAQVIEPSPDPYRFIEWTGGDAKDLGRKVLSTHSLYAAAGMGGVLVLLSAQDPELTKGAVDLAQGTDAWVLRTLNEVGNVRAVRPMALLLFLGSLTSRSRRFQDAAFTSLEAILFSNLITDALKSLTGRARPFQEQGPTRFRPLSGNTSFPSGHATTVFAFTTPWLLYYGNVPTTLLFILGGGTAFTRMADNFHWFTDVLVGSAVGFTTGYWLTRRHQRESPRIMATPVVGAGQVGFSMRVTW